MPIKNEAPVWGIEIDLAKIKQKYVAAFYIRYAKRSSFPKGLFVTNAEIREAISNYFKSPKTSGSNYLGHVGLRLEPKNKKAIWVDYYPITAEQAGFFLKKGIAQLLEHQVVARLKRDLPAIKIVEHGGPSSFRLKQLERRRLNTSYAIQEGLQALKKKIGRDTKWHRLRK